MTGRQHCTVGASPTCTSKLEQTLFDDMNGLCRELMAKLLAAGAATAKDYEPEQEERNAGNHGKRIVTLFGMIPEIKRTYYWNEDSGKGHYPFDDRLELVGRHTPTTRIFSRTAFPVCPPDAILIKYRDLLLAKTALFCYTTREMSEAGKLLEFISFCVEMFAARQGISGQEAYSRFDRFGVLDYLERNYEPLHTQGFNYILSCVDDYIAAQEAG